MEEFCYKKSDTLDSRYSTDTIILLKALALFLPAEQQVLLTLIIKVIEINHLLQYRNHPEIIVPRSAPEDMEQVFSEIKPSLSESTSQKIEQILQMISMMKMYQQMKDLLEVLGPLSAADPSSATSADASSPENTSSSDTGEKESQSSTQNHVTNIELTDLLKNMIPPENQQLLEMLLMMNQPN